ncbi:SDR family oxidoreductase [Pseudoalteromonas sp. T1lg10]|uniref:SDR family oxidoreductase n=1 Tax=Pseudoalteromonas sp. T1lg10 TaxID=2077093 RepID=UPI000CF71DF3|nr:SDR family oxidoreductase [Pseudoalteromonas sp. T1lg10]
MSAPIAVLTGASGGIGGAIAKRLAARNYRMILLGRDLPALEQVRQQLPSDEASYHLALQVDLSNDADISRVVDLLGDIGRCDLLVNSAGVNTMVPFESLSKCDLDAALAVNVRAPMLLSQGLLPLLQQGGGTIVNIGSSFGAIGYPLQAQYCATKFALRGFSEALARELSDTQVRVKYFAPRATQTAINSDKVTALNKALGNAMDTPEYVAEEFMRLLDSDERRRSVGAKESFFAKINALLPKVVDNALAKQLATIKQLMR